MSILPKNEPKPADQTPRSFLIWGESMSGKTYLARQFPNPLIINTDGNGTKVDTPCIEVRTFTEFLNVIDALVKESHTYETIIIDLIDDIQTMLSNHICNELGIEHESDVAYGKAFGQVKSKWKKLLMALNLMKIKPIYISHYVEKTENNATVLYPSLPTSFLNMTMGRCDLVIQCKKVGNNYIRMVTARREHYTREMIQDKHTLSILETITGMFPKITNGNITESQATVGASQTLPANQTPVRKNIVRRQVKTAETEDNKNDEIKQEVKQEIIEPNKEETAGKLTQTETITEKIKKEIVKQDVPEIPEIEEEPTLIGGALAGRL